MKTQMQIAETVRSKAEKSWDLCPDCPSPATLACMCAIVSMALARSFRKHGYTARLVEGTFRHSKYSIDSGHCWVISGGKIWDLTATQFDIEKRIFVVSTKDKRYKPKHTHNKLTVDRFKKWPPEQRPTTKILKKIAVT